MFEEKDEQILRNAYKNARSWVNMKAYPKEQRINVRCELIRQMDKSLVVSKHVYFTENEKSNFIIAGKRSYKAFCAFIKAHPEEITEQLEERATEIVDLLVILELQSLRRYRLFMNANEYLDLEKILSCKQYVREFLNGPVVNVIKTAISNKKFEAVKEWKMVYITKSGIKYHNADCRYLHKGKITCVGPERLYIYSDIKPCKCITDERIRELEAANQREQETKYMTAYVDESIRPNPSYVVDSSQGEMQNLLSIILCKGKIKNEELITKGNTVAQFVNKASSTAKTSDTAIEAIGEVMLKAAATGFYNNLIIFTDNASACSSWKKRKELEALSKAFESVRVTYVNRNRNKKADDLIRKNDVMQLPRTEMKKVVKIYAESEEAMLAYTTE